MYNNFQGYWFFCYICFAMLRKKIFIILFFVNCFVLVYAQDQRLWATYYGGPNVDYNNSIVTDASGNVYMAGTTSSASGIASGGFQNSAAGTADAFLVKFDSLGNRLWATYYGGTGEDFGRSVATDTFGNVFLAGYTPSVTGIASGGFQNTIGGGYDAFLVKFDASGNRLWGTYYGGAAAENANCVVTDVSGSVYLAGSTSTAVNIASGGFQNTCGGNSDAFLVKFDGNGNRLWATYYGGALNDFGYSLATDSLKNIYLAGNTKSTSGIASGGFQNNYSGFNDAFLVKFDAAGNRIWATYYGGSLDDKAYSLATGFNGDIYMAGFTSSYSGISFGGFQNSQVGSFGGFDAFLVRFNSLGNRIWATYYGGTQIEEGLSVTTDIAGNIYLGGDSYSSNYISSNGFQNALSGDENQFIATFDTSGNLFCATYYGQNEDENGCIAADNFGNIYLSGTTNSLAGISSAGFQNSFGGDLSDAYLVKFFSCGNEIIIPEVIIPELLVPNVITPNKDNLNDFFVINNLTSLYPENTLTIYNRWGNRIYEASNYQGSWSGSNHPAGVYFYILTLGDNKVKKGFIELIR